MMIVCIPMLLIGQLVLPPAEERAHWVREELAKSAAIIRAKLQNVRGSFSFEQIQPNLDSKDPGATPATIRKSLCEFNIAYPDLRKYHWSEVMTISNASQERTIDRNELACFRGDNWFSLVRRSDGEPWRVFRLGGDERETAKQKVRLNSDVMYNVETALIDPDVMDRPGRRIVSVGLDKRNEGCVRVELNDDKESDSGGAPQIYLVLNPAHYWVLRESSFRNSRIKKFDLKRRVEYDFARDVPTPTRMVYSNFDNERKRATSETTVIFREFEYASTPASEFTLSYYGIPELNSPARRHVPLWPLVLIAVIAVGLPTLAVILKFLARWWIDATDRSA